MFSVVAVRSATIRIAKSWLAGWWRFERQIIGSVLHLSCVLALCPGVIWIAIPGPRERKCRQV